jgi:hypothetical protein
VRPDKEHDEGEVQEVVDDEVAADVAGCVDILDVGREQMADVAELENEQDKPRLGGKPMNMPRAFASNSPVYGHDDIVHGEARRVQVVLIPYPVAEVQAISRSIKGIVDGYEDGQQPCHDREDLVGDDGIGAMRIPLREGVDYSSRQHQHSEVGGGKFDVTNPGVSGPW